MNVIDLAVLEYFACIQGHIVANPTREGPRLDTYPENNRGWSFADYANANYIETRPVNLIGGEIYDNLVGKTSLLDIGNLVLADRAELLHL